jgi:hypothetical protein
MEAIIPVDELSSTSNPFEDFGESNPFADPE